MGLFGKIEDSSEGSSAFEIAADLGLTALHVSRFWESKQGDIEQIGKEFGEDFKRQPGKIPTILVNAAARFDETVLDYQIEQAKERLEIEEKRAETFDSIEEKRERLEELLRKEQEHSSE